MKTLMAFGGKWIRSIVNTHQTEFHRPSPLHCLQYQAFQHHFLVSPNHLFERERETQSARQQREKKKTDRLSKREKKQEDRREQETDRQGNKDKRDSKREMQRR